MLICQGGKSLVFLRGQFSCFSWCFRVDKVPKFTLAVPSKLSMGASIVLRLSLSLPSRIPFLSEMRIYVHHLKAFPCSEKYWLLWTTTIQWSISQLLMQWAIWLHHDVCDEQLLASQLLRL